MPRNARRSLDTRGVGQLPGGVYYTSRDRVPETWMDRQGLGKAQSCHSWSEMVGIPS